MKILLLNHDKGWSGGQEHLKDLSSVLAMNGVTVHFCVRAGSKSDLRLRETGLPVHAFPKHSLVGLIGLLKRERYDVVSINREHDLLLSAMAWHLSFPFRKPGKFMMSYHTATARRQPFLSTADSVVCISEHVKNKLLAGNHVPPEKLKVLYYGITPGSPPDASKFTTNRPRRFFAGNTFPIIGMMGEFWKNQRELIAAIPRMLKSFPSLKIVFVGDNTDPGLFNPVLQQISELGIQDALIFTGRVPRERIPDIFYDFDLSLTTHRNEGFGIVHLESLAAGTPVVACDEGGFVDIFRGENVGTLVSGGPEDFADAVVDLLKDDERRFRLGANGYELVQRKYSLEKMGRNYLEFYHNLLRQT